MKIVARTLLVLVVLAASTAAFAQSEAHYSVTFTRVWTQNTHPFEYPEKTLVSGPHFSGLIGATHNGAYRIYKEGARPTPGLERLSEEGKHSPLDAEIKSAIASGKAGALFETGPIRDDGGMEKVEVTVTPKFPMVSAVAMIAPSPDWFAGAADVNLLEGGKWVASKSVDLYAYDSGGDDGKTYKASDADTNPKKPTMIANTPHFLSKGKRVRVATLTFTKL
ncbi:MAG: spondin domain-containing protein [Thermoanaerobaculia bacterium]